MAAFSSGRRALIALALALSAGQRAGAAGARARSVPTRRTAAPSRPRARVASLLRLPELTAAVGPPEGVVLGAVQQSDLVEIGGLLVGSFYPELVTLPPAGFSPLERALLESPVAWFNATYAAYLSENVRSYIERRIGAERLGARSRDDALAAPRPRWGTTRGTSLALAAADEASGRLLAFVELSVRPLDGRVPADMLDEVDALVRWALPRQPPPCAYLCNLCVVPRARRRGIGGALVRASQAVVGGRGWGHDALYLHVGMHDTPAARLYGSLGFEALRQYDPAPWRVWWLGAAEVTFYRRWLRGEGEGAIGAAGSAPEPRAVSDAPRTT